MATPSPADAAVEAAISRVLDAELAAHDDVDRATRDAAAIVEDAGATARAIAERTERRIRKLRAAFETRAAREVAAIDAEALAQDAGTRTYAGRSAPDCNARSLRFRAN